jgi:phosphoenolpyruvate-protein phosphotransferase (PTS system enzyme I)
VSLRRRGSRVGRPGKGERVRSASAGAPGIALGPASVWKSARPRPVVAALDPEEEGQRLARAVEAARRQLADVIARITAEVGEREGRLFKSHLALLEDPLLMAPAHEGISSRRCAEEAVESSVAALVARFEALTDARLRERAADIRDVGQRLLDNLSVARSPDRTPPSGSIVCAPSLNPSDVNRLAGAGAAGFVLAEGGPTSHAVILARAFGLPVVLGARSVLDEVRDGDPLAMDGAEGTLVIRPSRATADGYRWRMVEQRRTRRGKGLTDRPTVTRDGQRVMVRANVAGLGDIAAARAAGAEGVGLLRTEFLFLGRDTLPSEEEQLAAYRQIVAAMEPLPVVFRVLDAGADKPLPGIPAPAEANPALGLRGIRLCLNREDVFRTQLRALVRASRHGELAILLPMVTDVGELRQARRILAEVEGALSARGGPAAVSLGVMVETPAAALIVGALAKEADFFSVGTNDLVQYILGVDRQSETVAALYQPFHPAVLRLLRHVAETATAQGKPTNVCGEMASDPLAVPLLVGMGFDALSVAPSAIAAVKRAVRGVRRSEARRLVDEVLDLPMAADVLERLRRFVAEGEGPRVRQDRRRR